jgi:hypothetical protein
MNITTLTLNKSNIKDFAFERNELLKKSKTEWNLFLDNDEKIQNDEFILTCSEIESYIISRKNYFLDQYVGEDRIIRLVKRGTGKFVRAVHEIWKPDNIKNVGKINNNYIIHNTANNLKDYINKINKYSTLHAKENNKEKKKVNLSKIIFYPTFKFIVELIKSKNIVFSIIQSFHSFLAWSKIYLKSY